MGVEMILLGLLREPASGYDLKMSFDQTVRHFWAAEFSQIYGALKRLEQAGSLRCRTKPSPKGPDRKVYSLTAAGRKKLRAWLAGDPRFGDERYAYVAQLFFMAELSDFELTVKFIEQVREMRAKQLETLQRIERDLVEKGGAEPREMPDDEFHKYLTVRAGQAVAAARMAWCEEALERIQERTCATSRPRGKKKRRKP